MLLSGSGVSVYFYSGQTIAQVQSRIFYNQSRSREETRPEYSAVSNLDAPNAIHEEISTI